jgi:hypothetical protein
MSRVIPLPPPKGSPGPAVDPRAEKIFEAIKTLLTALSPAEQHRILRELTASLQAGPAPRAGEVLGTIVRWLPRISEFTVAEAKKEVDAQGLEATQKQIFNAIGYLARRGYIQRRGYGRYLVGGAEIISVDNFGLEPAKDEDD